MNTAQIHLNSFNAPPQTTSHARMQPIDVTADRRPTFLRLVKIELRKMSDTRSGLAIGAIIASLAVIVPVIQLIVLAQGGVDSLSFSDFLSGAEVGMRLLLPVLVVLLITSEWTQRTAMTTFTLVPNRTRVVAAKLVAALGVTLGWFLFAAGLAAAATAVSPAVGNPAAFWDMNFADLGTELLGFMSDALMAFAFGALLLSSAAALVAFYSIMLLLPTLLPLLYGVSGLSAVAKWIDPTYGLFAVRIDPSSLDAWSHVAVAALIWIVVPLAIGMRRIVRMEIK